VRPCLRSTGNGHGLSHAAGGQTKAGSHDKCALLGPKFRGGANGEVQALCPSQEGKQEAGDPASDYEIPRGLERVSSCAQEAAYGTQDVWSYDRWNGKC